MAGPGSPQTQVAPLLYAADGLPAVMVDGVAAQQRGTRRGEAFVQNLVPTMGELADDQSFFSTTTPTPGTAVTYALQQTFSDIVGLVHVQNTDNAGGKRIFLHALRLICVAVGSAATSVEGAIKVDVVPRVPTANSSALVPLSTRSGAKVASVASVYVPSGGALTMPAASGGARLLDRFKIRQGIPVAGDVFMLQFGQVDGAPPNVGTGVGRYVESVVPVVIDPGQSATIYLWQPAITTTAPTFEIALSHFER